MAVDYSLMEKLKERDKYLDIESIVKFPLDPFHASALLFINAYCGFESEGETEFLHGANYALELLLQKNKSNSKIIIPSEDNLSTLWEMSYDIIMKPRDTYKTINELLDSIELSVENLITTAIINMALDFNSCFTLQNANLFPGLDYAFRKAMERGDQRMMDLIQRKRTTQQSDSIQFLASTDYITWEADLYTNENVDFSNN